MKEFKKFVKAEESKAEAPKAECAVPEGMNIPGELPKIESFDPKDVDVVKNLTKKYQNNQPQLVSDIVALAEQNRKEGKLKNSDLDNMEKKLSPMLSGEQKKMLKNIMSMLKK